uniref:Pif n=1 Tax=Sinohyriopsis cumingii TaxID=165450 RepID=A0A2U8XEL1_SINCU|nr:Pif [Sinohyriopsis cumingii]
MRRMFIPLALLLCTAVHITSSTRQLSGCLSIPADIVFAVDSSDYVSDLDFEKVKVFLMGIIRLLKLDDNQIRVGVVQYDDTVTNTVSLTGRKIDLSREIHKLKKSPGIPRAYLGLRSLRGQFSTGGRPNVPQIGIVLTGGLGEYAQMSYSQGKLLRDSGIRMMMVGFGSRVTTDEIDDVAWNPQLAMTSPNAEDLTKHMKSFLNKLCNCMSPTSGGQASLAFGGSSSAVARVGPGGIRAPIIGEPDPISNHLPMQNGQMIPDEPIPLPAFAAHTSSSAGRSGQTGVQDAPLPDRGNLRSSRLQNLYSSQSGQSQPDVQLPQLPNVPFPLVPDLAKSPPLPPFPPVPSVPVILPLPSLPYLPIVPELPGVPSLPELPSISPGSSAQVISPSLSISDVLQVPKVPDLPKLDLSDFTVPKLLSMDNIPSSPLQTITDVDITDLKLKLPKLADIADKLKPDLPDLSSLVASLKDSPELAKLSKLANEAAKMHLPDGLGDVIKALKEAVSNIKGDDSPSKKDDSSSSSSDDDDDVPEGICNQCDGKAANCRVRLPNACDKYVICSGDDDSDSSNDDSNSKVDNNNDDDSSDDDDKYQPKVRTCPFGEFWDDIEDVCKHSGEVDCPFDSCKNMRGSPGRRSSASCRAYWRCEWGRSVIDCCPVGTAFKENDGCVTDESCTGSCSDDEPDSPFCDKKPVAKQSSFYRQYTAAKVWVRMPCAPGTFFSEGSCGCNRRSSGIPQDVGKKPTEKDIYKRKDRDYQSRPDREVYMCFDSDTSDTSGKYTYVENDNSLVSVFDGVAHFQGDGKLSMPRFSGAPYGNNWIFKLKYKLNDDPESSDDSGSNNDNSSSSDSNDGKSAESSSSDDDNKKDKDDDLMTLLSNGDCSNHRCYSKPSLVLATSDDETILEVTDSTQKLHRLRVSKRHKADSDSSDSDDNGDSDSSDSKDKNSNKDDSNSDSDEDGNSDSSDESKESGKSAGWRTVVVSLRKDKLKLKDGNRVAEESFQDSTPLVSYSSLQIGGGSIYNSFKGLMDEIELMLDDD